jgi:hypothetical protein
MESLVLLLVIALLNYINHQKTFNRYLVQALVSLFNFDLRLIRQPRKTIHNFSEEFKMVMNCHRERKFLLTTQPHLTNWLPIAVPLKVILSLGCSVIFVAFYYLCGYFSLLKTY